MESNMFSYRSIAILTIPAIFRPGVAADGVNYSGRLCLKQNNKTNQIYYTSDEWNAEGWMLQLLPLEMTGKQWVPNGYKDTCTV